MNFGVDGGAKAPEKFGKLSTFCSCFSGAHIIVYFYWPKSYLIV